MAPIKGRVLMKYTSCLPACAAGPECMRPGTVAQSTHRCPDCDRHIHGICGVPNPDRGNDRPGDSATWAQLCFRCAVKRGLVPVAKRGRTPNTFKHEETTLPEARVEVSPSSNVNSPATQTTSKKRHLEGPAASVRHARRKQEPKTPEDMIDEENAASLGTRGGRKTCSHPGCGKFSVQSGVCYTHGANRKKCSDPECTNWSVSSGVCYRHGAKRKKNKRG